MNFQERRNYLWQAVVVDGSSYNKAGKSLGISGERVRQIITSEARKRFPGQWVGSPIAELRKLSKGGNDGE